MGVMTALEIGDKMNFFEKLIKTLSFSMETPKVFSLFHICFLVGFIVATVGISLWLYKKPNDKAVRIFVAVCWGVMLLLEIYKQVSFSFAYDEITKTATWDYKWYSFPFQLCSSPFYIFPFVAFLKDCKVRNAFIAFACTFSFFGGFVVMVYPGAVFTAKALINVQTMVHHSLQALCGIVLCVAYRKKLSWKCFATGLIVFAGMLSIAQFLNWFLPVVTGESVAMFSLSWKIPCDLPVLNIVYANTPYFVFLLAYIAGFVAVATIVFSVIKLVLFISAKRRAAKGGVNA